MIQILGLSSSLVVMGWDSCPKGREFKSQQHIPSLMDLFHIFLAKFCYCLTRKINEKEAGMAKNLVVNYSAVNCVKNGFTIVVPAWTWHACRCSKKTSCPWSIWSNRFGLSNSFASPATAMTMMTPTKMWNGCSTSSTTSQRLCRRDRWFRCCWWV